MRLYNRKATVTLNDVEVSDLRLTFSVKNTTDPEANEAEAEIYNLNENTRGRITALDRPRLVIEAGYEDVFGEIFRGKSVQVYSYKGRTGWVTKAQAKDGADALRKMINVSLAPGASLEQAFTGVAKQLGLNVNQVVQKVKSGNFAEATKTLVDGFVAFGRGLNELDKVSKKLGAEFSVQGEELHVMLPSETLQASAILVSDETGLIGSPERIYDEKRPNVLIVRFQHLLLPDFRPYARAELSTREFGGGFRIEKVEHQGDTHNAQQWISTVEASAL